jgi:hypothetical protein
MQKFYHNIGFREKRHFFAKNFQKSQKIVIITSTPGRGYRDRPLVGEPPHARPEARPPVQDSQEGHLVKSGRGSRVSRVSRGSRGSRVSRVSRKVSLLSGKNANLIARRGVCPGKKKLLLDGSATW